MEAVRIEHCSTYICSRLRVLVLGTMPSPKSREIGLLRASAKPVLEGDGRAVRRARAARHRGTRGVSRCARHRSLGRSVVLHHRRASDASIVDPVAKIFRALLSGAAEAVFTTGSKATALYRRFGAPQLPGLAHGTSFHQSCERACASTIL
ncbi:MAG: DNA-deoxyinosine glycosylase [Eggerthellaceae bacterium]